VLKFLVSVLLLFLVLTEINAQAHKDNRDSHNIQLKKITGPIQIDGNLEEGDWKNAQGYSNFMNKWPTDEGLAEKQTTVKVLRDDENLYFGFYCVDDRQHVIRSLKHDGNVWDNDYVAINIDPENARTNGFYFGISSMGVLAEGLISSNDISFDWNNIWEGEAQQYDDHWTVEVKIPLKSLRYRSSNLNWGINFLRGDPTTNTYSAWAPIPVNRPAIDLSYTGLLNWDEEPKQMSSKVVLIPYITSSSIHNIEDGENFEFKFNSGMDAKIAVTSSLNLDLTLNPDFSQVEVDDQVTNLDRFSIFFPEKRTFFLENADMFNRLGIPPVRPFFSRRIGIYDGETVPIIFGARLSGNLLPDTRINVMNMQTAEKDDFLAQNYTAAAFNQRVLKRSQIRGFYVNRQAIEGSKFLKDDRAGNAGLELIYATENGNFTAWQKLHSSFQPNNYNDNYYYGAGFEMRDSRNFFIVDYGRLGDNYIAEIGFTPRLYNYDPVIDTTFRIGLQYVWTLLEHTLRFKDHEKFQQLNFFAENFFQFNLSGNSTERHHSIGSSLRFKNASRVFLNVNYIDVELPYEINFTEDGENLPAKEYDYIGGEVGYNSDHRKPFSYRLRAVYGGFYNGTRVGGRVELAYRKQPRLNVNLNFQYNKLSFPDLYGETELFLVGPKIEYGFSKKMLWTTFLQYNTQSNNFNINSRFKWRYKPMSDAFLVYTDNYIADKFAVANRAIVFKINHWFSL